MVIHLFDDTDCCVCSCCVSILHQHKNEWIFFLAQVKRETTWFQEMFFIFMWLWLIRWGISRYVLGIFKFYRLVFQIIVNVCGWVTMPFGLSRNSFEETKMQFPILHRFDVRLLVLKLLLSEFYQNKLFGWVRKRELSSDNRSFD